ncbi:50S ribosomal protein L25 [Acidicapsa ligni]|uniref:50S ribosomal protein L25 n=1 Tax=Acidicapsa ligni TaxID=542300 RepID=UPI0021E028EA|nr:50S ribosomal protein L25 [Acidicapsa ligni]
MPEVVIATPRQVPANGKFNKNAARQVRVAGKIPAVIYGAGKESIALELDPKQILRILHSESGHNTIFDVDVTGSGKVKAMIVDWQYEPIRDTLLHIDLKRIALDKAIRVSVPVRLIGVASGVKNEGGMLDQVMREVELECLPAEIPSHIDVDVTNLALFGAIHVSDLPHSGSIKFLSAEDATIAHVISIRAEAAPEAAAAGTEPEVAKKGKTDAPAADAKK